MKNTFANIVLKEGKFYVARCLNVEVSSFGETKEEAITNLQEALELYFEDTSINEIPQVESPKIVSTQLEHA